MASSRLLCHYDYAYVHLPAQHFPCVCSEFGVRNPMIRAFDVVDMSRPDPRSVAALFAEKQLAALKAQNTGNEEAAYEVAKAWLLENGREMFNRLAVPPGIAQTMVRPRCDSGLPVLLVVVVVHGEAKVGAALAFSMQAWCTKT